MEGQDKVGGEAGTSGRGCLGRVLGMEMNCRIECQVNE
jgi:hypothetical protein